MTSSNDILPKVASWVGFSSSIGCIIIGLTYLITVGAELKWPKAPFSFYDDINKTVFRYTIFSLRPDVLFNLWTPFLFGVLGIATHLKLEFEEDSKSKGFIKYITLDFLNYFVFNLLAALFGSLGYVGGLGLIFGGICLLASVLDLVVIALAKNPKASLELKLPFI